MDTLALLIFLAGFVAGLFGAMLGLGGGIFLVPILALLLGLPMHYAIGTSVIAVVATSSTAASNYIKAGLTNIRLGLLLQISTAGGAVVGGIIATRLGDSVLAGVFGVVMAYTSYSMFRSSRGKVRPEGESLYSEDVETHPPVTGGQRWGELEASYFDRAHQEAVTYQPVRAGAGMAICTLGGVVSGMLGIGGGAIQVPVMHLIMKVPLRAAAGTSNLMVGVTAVASAFIYYGKGFIVPALMVPAVFGVFLGAQIGTRVAQRVSSKTLGIILALVLMFASIQMILEALGIRLG